MLSQQPKGTYDMAEDMTVNTAIGSPLLSRFDLVLLLLDTKNKARVSFPSSFLCSVSLVLAGSCLRHF